jgi:hypothetical protein
MWCFNHLCPSALTLELRSKKGNAESALEDNRNLNAGPAESFSDRHSAKGTAFF